MTLETLLVWKGAGVAIGLVIGGVYFTRGLIKEFGVRGSLKVIALAVRCR